MRSENEEATQNGYPLTLKSATKIVAGTSFNLPLRRDENARGGLDLNTCTRQRVKFTNQALLEDEAFITQPQCTAQSKVSNFDIVVAGSGKKRARNSKGKAHRNSHSSHPCGYAREKGDRHADLDQVSAEELIAAPAMWCPNPADTSRLRVQFVDEPLDQQR